MESVHGQLAGGIAHDFNNILASVILGFTGLVTSGMAAEDPKLEHLRRVLRAGRRAVELTRQLLAFGKQVMQPRA